MIGDPSGRTELREMLSKEKIEENVRGIKKQLDRYLDFTHDRALLLNNADWLLHLNYVEFLREIGVHFSVNRMLTAECFRARMERGLSFIEFNYMLLQAYDYLFLYRKYGCKLQVGGDDQWSNILAGADLIRRVEGGKAYVLTWPLLTTASGKKMGKTESGSVWLDPARTSPSPSTSTGGTPTTRMWKTPGLLYLFTDGGSKAAGLLEGKRLMRPRRSGLRSDQAGPRAEAADAAKKAAEALFSGEAAAGEMPTTQVEAARYPEGIPLLDLLVLTGLAPSKKEGRRLVEQKGIALNREVISDQGFIVSLADYRKDGLLLRKGKKTYHRVEIV